MSRGYLLISAGLFGVLSLGGAFFYGVTSYSVLLVLAGLVHLLVVARWYPRIDRFFVGVHYSVLVVTLAGVVIYVWRVVGPTAEVPKTLFAIVAYTFSGESGYSALGTFLAISVSTILVVLVVMERFIHRGNLRIGALAAGFFAASILAFACDYSAYDPLSRVGATRPEDSQGFEFAAGLAAIEFPMLLHLLVLAVLVLSWLYRRRAVAAN
jgi:hypothetical protein